ncbi:MAG: hypothetical protein ACLFUJ_13500 [Phycisphaerae bacterium]
MILSSLAVAAVLAPGCKENEEKPNTASVSAVPAGRCMADEQIDQLQMGMTMNEVVNLLGGPGTALSVPAMVYPARHGGSYYLAFFDLNDSAPETASALVLYGVLRTNETGQSVWLLPTERAGQPFRLPNAYLRSRGLASR